MYTCPLMKACIKQQIHRAIQVQVQISMRDDNVYYTQLNSLPATDAGCGRSGNEGCCMTAPTAFIPSL